MSTTRSVLLLCGKRAEVFIEEFGFYLDHMDRAFSLEGRIGLDEDALGALPAMEQNTFKTYLFLTESVNTTVAGTLHLFAGNLCADTFALLRMVYEVAALMHYGNMSAVNREEVYRCLFKSGKEEKQHRKGEWDLIKKATAQWESEKQGLREIKQYINNYGAHVSRAKIVLGNVKAMGNQSVSSLFLDNTRNREFVMGLDMLHSLFMIVLGEYDKQAALYQGASPSVGEEIVALTKEFISKVRPKLQERARLPKNSQ